jgi:hypothetical protein
MVECPSQAIPPAVQLIGPAALRGADGTTVPVGGRTRASLFALLLLTPGRWIASEQLVASLWPSPDPRAQHRLHVHVAALRRLVQSCHAPVVIESRRGRYRAVAARSDVDLHRVADAAGRAPELAPDGAERVTDGVAQLLFGEALDGLGPLPEFAAARRAHERAVSRLQERAHAPKPDAAEPPATRGLPSETDAIVALLGEAETRMNHPNPRRSLDTIEAQLDGVERALRQTWRARDSRFWLLSLGMRQYWLLRGPPLAGLQTLTAALARGGGEERETTLAAYYAGQFALEVSVPPQVATSLLRNAALRAQGDGDELFATHIRVALARALCAEGRTAEAVDTLDECLAAFRALDDTVGDVATLNELSQLALAEKRVDDARAYASDCVRLGAGSLFPRVRGQAALAAARVEAAAGDRSAARVQLASACARFAEVDDRLLLTKALAVALELADGTHASALAGGAAAFCSAIGVSCPGPPVALDPYRWTAGWNRVNGVVAGCGPRVSAVLAALAAT